LSFLALCHGRDGHQNAIDILQNVVVPETENSVPARVEEPSSYGIPRFRMLATIRFDDELGINAKKIGDVRSDRRLPTKLQPVQLPIAEVVPQTLFGVGRVLTQASGMRVGLTDRCHVGSIEEGRPSPNPLP
jgi:hypothetical protein